MLDLTGDREFIACIVLECLEIVVVVVMNPAPFVNLMLARMRTDKRDAVVLFMMLYFISCLLILASRLLSNL